MEVVSIFSVESKTASHDSRRIVVRREQGLLGSRAYVAEHFADLKPPPRSAVPAQSTARASS